MDIKKIVQYCPQQKQVSTFPVGIYYLQYDRIENEVEKHEVYRGEHGMKRFCKSS